MHPNPSDRGRQRHAMQRIVRKTDAYSFFDWLTDDGTLDRVESLLPVHRERLLPPTEALAMFLAQALSADASCQNAVNEFVARRIGGGLSACSTSTAAYCRARARLPQEMVAELMRGIGGDMTTAAGPAWRRRPVRLVDGTTLSMADTEANQAAFAQPSTQKPGLGFPICRLLALFCLSSGAVLEANTCAYQGKGNDEQTLLRGMLDQLDPGDVLVGDALFATYFLLADLQRRGVDGVFEQYGARRRSTDFRRGRRIGQRDHLIEIEKPKLRPMWMTAADYAAAPASLTVRETRVAGKTLVTTFVCADAVPKGELATLYRQRWHAELNLRNLKTTMGMQMLRCKSPAMAVKEVWIYLLAYNLIRRVMLRSALNAGIEPISLSFKHALQLCIAFGMRFSMDAQAVLPLIAQRRVGKRPGRAEPRAVKRRPKPFPLLMMPRQQARDEVLRRGHRVH
jgi:Transposase DDE domain